MWKKTPPPTAEQELLKRARAGDERAYEQLILACTPALYLAVGRVLYQTEGGAEIEPILQETFWRAWQSLSRYPAGEPILPYLTSIAKNLVQERWHITGRLIEEKDGRPAG
ncbi:MAG: sigma factor [Anaerolineaceae bacterium]|nr:sigma factor [Anaerolineaceae bacterium]